MMIGGFAIAASAVPAGASTTNISLDGYCDGMSLNIPSIGYGTTDTTDGYRTGCESAALFGVNRPNLSNVYGVRKGTEYLTSLDGYFWQISRKGHTWTVFGYNGNQIYVVNSGTWSLGAPAADAVRASSVATGARSAAAVQPYAARDISFDGYCDGLHIVTPSAGLATKTTIDGYSINWDCVGSNGPMIGARTTIDGYTKTFVASVSENGTFYQFIIFPNNHWVLLGSDGSQIVLVNSGTWTAGAPVAAVGGTRSTLSGSATRSAVHHTSLLG
jgi:hypothetical protein